MKRTFWLIGTLIGFLSSLVVMAISYLGNIWLALPFFPFDLFDWLTRHLPGSIIEFTLKFMVSIINSLHLGPTDTTAKLAEQLQALALVSLTGLALGLILALVAKRQRQWVVGAGLTAGGLLWIGITVVELSLPNPGLGLVEGLIWLLILLVGWGYQLSRWILLFTQSPTPAPPEAVKTDKGSPTILNKKLTRRNALVLGGASLISAVVLIDGLKKLRQAGTTAANNSTPQPAGGANTLAHSFAYGPEYTSGVAASPSPAVLASRIDPAPGTRPEITSSDAFYRIDINTIAPVMDGGNWHLDLTGLVDHPLSLTLDDIWSRPAVTQAVTLACVSNPVGGDLTSSNFWTGTKFKDILKEAGLQSSAQQITFECVDGYYEELAVKEAMDDRTLLVYAMNGAPLTADHGYPIRLYVPNHYGMRLPKWITKMTVISGSINSYWVDRGWDAAAIPNTTSVIDTATVDTSSLQQTGIMPLGGIAWAGARGISKVEVQIDKNDWVVAELRNPAVSPLTWVQWRYDWQPTPGSHKIQVRATDGNGDLQDPTFNPPYPGGATGINSVNINI